MYRIFFSLNGYFYILNNHTIQKKIVFFNPVKAKKHAK